MITTKRKIFIQRTTKGRQVLSKAPSAIAATPVGRVPRISKLVALALHFEWLLREGKVSDQSELARLCRVTQPRATQLMNLLHLDPGILEELMYLPMTRTGRDPINERMLRPLAAEMLWSRQRAMWSQLRRRVGGEDAAGVVP
jgi:hypothetical protein